MPVTRPAYPTGATLMHRARMVAATWCLRQTLQVANHVVLLRSAEDRAAREVASFPDVAAEFDLTPGVPSPGAWCWPPTALGAMSAQRWPLPPIRLGTTFWRPTRRTWAGPTRSVVITRPMVSRGGERTWSRARSPLVPTRSRRRSLRGPLVLLATSTPMARGSRARALCAGCYSVQHRLQLSLRASQRDAERRLPRLSGHGLRGRAAHSGDGCCRIPTSLRG